MYTDKSIPVDDDDIDPDEYVNLRTWFLQLIVWCICSFLAKLFVFFVQLNFHRELGYWGTAALVVFEGHPKIELVVVMVILPFLSNTLMLWI